MVEYLRSLVSKRVIAEDWVEPLTPVADQLAVMGEFLRTQQAEGKPFLPRAVNVLRAFRYPFTAVRVLIVGQDPYPTPGHPIGLSFAVDHKVRPLPGSLQNIYKEYHHDLGLEPPEHGDISVWCERGVMLLNRTLTVEPGKPASHRGMGWEQITSQAVAALAARPLPLVAILWGKQAQELAPIMRNTDQTAVIESVHPSPMSAIRGFFGSKPFSRSNNLLEKMGAEPVDWSLT